MIFKNIEMRKCAIFFLILVVTLIFAVVSEGSNAELNSKRDNVVAVK